MWKKSIAIWTAVILLLCMVPTAFAAQTDDGVTQFVSQLGIMTGYADGSFGLDNYVTRAEFTKIAVKSSSYRNSVATNLRISPFYDVSYSHWAAPYIQLASANQLVTGYVDSTFRPENLVTYEEAVTVLLRILGYTTEDFGSSWPYGQVGMAESLGLSDNVSKTTGDYLTRRDVAYMIYNLMDTKAKGSNDYYIKTFDAEIIEDVILIATIKEDPSVGSDKVVTSAGTYKIGSGFSYDDVGKKGDLVVKNSDEVMYFVPYAQTVESYAITDVMGSDLLADGKALDIDDNITAYYKSQKTTYSKLAETAEEGMTLRVYRNENGVIEYIRLIGLSDTQIDFTSLQQYTVYSVLDSGVIVYTNGQMQQLNIPDSTTAYKENSTSTFGAMRSSLEMGDVLSVKWDTSTGKIKYINVEDGDVEGPVTVKSSNWYDSLGVNVNSASIMRDSVKVTAEDIQFYDVVYYVKDLDIVLAYSKKVTGIYEKASPNRDLPTTVTVSGKEYSIESVTAFNKLSSNGTYGYGDTITLLLGKNGQIADVMLPSDTSQTLYGYVLETGSKEFTNADGGSYTSNYVKVALPDGTTNEYKTKSGYSSYFDTAVRITFKDGYATLTSVKSDGTVSGKVNASARTLGKYELADEVQIIDVSAIDKYTSANVVSVFLQRLDGVTISSSSVLYYAKNSKNEISTLILDDVTGDTYQYGVVTSASSSSGDMKVNGRYTFDIGGVSQTLSTNNSSYNVGSGQPAMFFVSNGQVKSIKPLTQLGTVQKLTGAEATTSKGDVYLLASDVAVYQRTGSAQFLKLPLEDVLDSDQYRFTAYYDKSQAGGGRIRVIIAEKK